MKIRVTVELELRDGVTFENADLIIRAALRTQRLLKPGTDFISGIEKVEPEVADKKHDEV